MKNYVIKLFNYFIVPTSGKNIKIVTPNKTSSGVTIKAKKLPDTSSKKSILSSQYLK